MKVAIASSGLGHVSRGVESWASDLGRALAERGVDVILCKGGGVAETDYERVVPCRERGAESTVKLAKRLPKWAWHLGLGSAVSIEQTSFALGLIRLLRREPVDVVHVQDAQLGLLLQYANRLGILKAKPILGHGTNEPATFLKKFDYVQHLAPHHLESIREAGAWKPSWTAIPNFIDVRRFHPGRSDALREELGVPIDALVVVCVAAIKRSHKRIDALIDEFGRLRDSRPDLPAYLVVAGGREPETDELIQIGKSRLGDRVRFLVGFDRNRMADLDRMGDVFVLASLREMMPIALVEATATGLPCVVNRHPILEWMVGPGGLAVDFTEPGAMAKGLSELLDDPERRRTLSENARAHCLANFERGVVVDRILAYYDDVLGDRGTPSG